MSTASIDLRRGNCCDILGSIGRVGAVITDPPIKAYWPHKRAFLHATDWLERCLAIADTVMFTVSLEVADKFPLPAQRATWRWTIDTPIFVYGLAADLPDMIEEPWPQQEAFGHPSCKPLPLLRRLVKATRGTVLDPFMGTGTTGVACVEQGRPFVGIELDERHFETASKRMSEPSELDKLHGCGYRPR